MNADQWREHERKNGLNVKAARVTDPDAVYDNYVEFCRRTGVTPQSREEHERVGSQ